MPEEKVILVNEHDAPIGTEEKLKAHQAGLLHRAISVFVLNEKGEMLIQQRAAGKYHSAGLWSNACCSHPRPGESTIDAAKRRLKEEMGIIAEPKFLFSFIYKTAFENNLIEHELDHIFYTNVSSGIVPAPDLLEVQNWEWVSSTKLLELLSSHPENYTYWFRQLTMRVLSELPGQAENQG